MRNHKRIFLIIAALLMALGPRLEAGDDPRQTPETIVLVDDFERPEIPFKATGTTLFVRADANSMQDLMDGEGNLMLVPYDLGGGQKGLVFASHLSQIEKPGSKRFKSGSVDFEIEQSVIAGRLAGGKYLDDEALLIPAGKWRPASPEDRNRLGGATGSWNLDPTDINNSYCDADIIEMAGKDGKKTGVLALTYSVDSERPAQNGYWTRLENLNAVDLDHLEFEIKGDADRGFTDRLMIELKKCKKGPCTGTARDETIKGSYEVRLTSEWETVSIPLNRITGIIDFMDPQAWKNPEAARKNLSELVFIFNKRHVTEKAGRIYIDNIRFVKTGDPGPTAVDFPPRKGLKTKTRIKGVEYARFLIKRLGGFPSKVRVHKKFPKDDEAFLREVAKDTWRFFDEAVDQENGLPLDTIQLGVKEAIDEGTWIGDYTNVTNIGVYLMVLVSAYDMGFIDELEAIARLRQTMSTLERMEYHASGFPYNYYDTTTLERTSYFVSVVDSAWLMAGLYVVKNAFPDILGDQAQGLLDRGDLVFFYDPVEGQFFHGYYGHLEVYADHHYGTFYTEPRVASYMGIARGEIPEEHWYSGLIRTFPESYAWQTQRPVHRVMQEIRGHQFYGGYYVWKDLKYIPSWGGSAFEALMPGLVLNEKELSPKGLGLNNLNHSLGQIRYATEVLKQPVWGMSPSCTAEGGYSEYGVRPFGSKGYKAGVVTPHASFLTLDYTPREAIQNLRKMLADYDIYGEYGFYDAVQLATGKVSRRYLALDQGMIFVSLNNYLNDGAIRKRFHRDPVLKKAEFLLTEEDFFRDEPKAGAK